MAVSSMLPMLMSGGGGGGQGGSGLFGQVTQSMANIGSGLLGGAVGYFQRRAAKKALSKLQRPEYEIPNEILENQKRAQMAANEGLPSAQYNQAMQNIQRQQNRALTSASDRRGGLMALPGLQQQANDSLLNLDVKNAEQRLKNQQQLYGINSQVAGYKDKQWDINKMQPYQRDYTYNMQLLGQGNQNMFAGADKLLGGLALAGSSGSNFGSGLFGSGSGNGRRMTAGKTNSPTYYGGNQDYSGFETGY